MNRHKQAQIIRRLKAKEAEIVCKVEQSPQEFDPSKMNVNIEFPKPTDIVVRMSFNMENKKPDIPLHTNRVSKLRQITQEKF